MLCFTAEMLPLQPRAILQLRGVLPWAAPVLQPGDAADPEGSAEILGEDFSILSEDFQKILQIFQT